MPSGMKVLCWIDSNGGLHIDDEIYQHFVPKFKFKGSIRDIEKAESRLAEAKQAIKNLMGD